MFTVNDFFWAADTDTENMRGATPIWEGVPPRPRDFGGWGTLTTTTTALERGRGYPGHPFRPRRFLMIFHDGCSAAHIHRSTPAHRTIRN